MNMVDLHHMNGQAIEKTFKMCFIELRISIVIRYVPYHTMHDVIVYGTVLVFYYFYITNNGIAMHY